ncbi:MAG: bifunctional DNA-formamidopyrimidine glycosylase/DNA-(apurinic or apyrimidinic site) lyase [Patescibacteria group bacterium]
MPELPEVETIRRDLAKAIINKKIVDIVIGKKKLIKNSLKTFSRDLYHHKITQINRVGKLLIFALDNKKYLLIHLKMTGQLIYQHCQTIVAGGHNYPPLGLCLPNQYSHIIFTFADHSQLFFNDQRQFGYLNTVNHRQLQTIVNEYGIEPLAKNFTLASLTKALANKKTVIKTTLLNQKNIAGIGNIYADEICHEAKIKPQRTTNKLTATEIKKLFLSANKIIKYAIKYRGTTFSDYVDSQGAKGNYSQHLKVYGREGKICLSCHQAKIKKIKIAGRGTHYCPHCQK